MAYYMFSYGSNNPDQLSERLEVSKADLEIYPAYLENYERYFVGHSNNWGGGVASIRKKSGRTVYGLIVLVDDEDLELMTQYEGDLYKLKNIIVMADLEGDGEFEKVKTLAYIRTKGPVSQPSDSYLKAIAKTINTFWISDNGRKLTIKDFIIPRR